LVNRSNISGEIEKFGSMTSKKSVDVAIEAAVPGVLSALANSSRSKLRKTICVLL
jgi:hypothetical protein